MQEKFDWVDWFKDLIPWLTIGGLSGVIQLGDIEHRGKSWFEKTCVVMSGACFAGFVNPLVIWLIEYIFDVEVGLGAYGSLAFLVGLIGANLVSPIIRMAKAFRWSDIKDFVIAILTYKKK